MLAHTIVKKFIESRTCRKLNSNHIFFIYIYGFFSDFFLIFAVDKLIFIDSGLSMYEVVTIVSLWACTQMVAEIPSGIISDRWNRKYILALSGLFFGAGFIFWLVLPTFLGYAIGFSFLFGIATALLSGTDQAYIYDVLRIKNNQESYAKVFGLYRASRFIGLATSWALGGYLSDFSYQYVIYGSMLSGFTMMLIAFLMLPNIKKSYFEESEETTLKFLSSAISYSFKHREILSIILFSLITGSSFMLLDEYWPVLYRELGFSNTQFGILVAASAMIGGLGSMVAHKFIRRPLLSLSIVSLIIATVFIVAGGIENKYIIVFTVFSELLFAVASILSSEVIQRNSKDSNRATIASVNAFVMQAFVITGFIFGYIVEVKGIQSGYLYMGFFCLLFPVLLAFFELIKNQSTDTYNDHQTRGH